MLACDVFAVDIVVLRRIYVLFVTLGVTCDEARFAVAAAARMVGFGCQFISPSARAPTCVARRCRNADTWP
jgi:hypothetical protein